MNDAIFLIVYLTTAVGAYFRSVSTTGKTSKFGLAMSAFGYFLVCLFFELRDHLDHSTWLLMLILLLSAAVFVFVIKATFGTRDRQDAYDAFAKEQNEIAGSVYSTLDPDSSWSAPERTEWLDQNRPQMLKLLPLILLIIVVCGVDFVFYYYIQTVLPHQTDAAIFRAPLVHPEDLKQVADQHKLVKCELWTGKALSGVNGKIAYMRLYRRDKDSLDSNPHWIDSVQEPATLTLFSADKKTKVFVSGDDIDRMFLKIYFDDSGKKRKTAPVPHGWLKEMNKDEEKYLVKGLPAERVVTCAGIIEQYNGALWLRPFAFKDYEHGAIVTEVSADTLDDYLKKHPAFGPQIVDLKQTARGESKDRRYETDIESKDE